MTEEQFILRTKSYVQGNEGFKNYVYKDTRGFLSMGYGWKIHYEAAKSIEGYDKLSLQQKVAIIDLTFNMGVNWVTKFPNLIQNIKKASLAENDIMRELYLSNAANELKYKNYKENDLELSEYWGQVKGRAIRNYQLLLNDYFDWDDYADPIVDDEDDEVEEVFQATEDRYSSMFGNDNMDSFYPTTRP